MSVKLTALSRVLSRGLKHGATNTIRSLGLSGEKPFEASGMDYPLWNHPLGRMLFIYMYMN